uniref:ATP synthase complex subunit 8 n=4 Tax=Acestrorhamphidae TaxID=3391093 RepID=A0A1Q1PRD9_PSAFA|nr:ATPase subunit 8 [Psalidodon paranae]YP_009704446.1 ATPase subunit 8 [Oligosarcus argenteus]YP_010026568.1 ATP synthase F0 subunit 8 [Psalidodon rivularis]YP_010026581.1 ATP synthase F0 subunit 8 [Psalidodon fasciatus]UMM62312.1 ATP synthase subunit 8 [Psalidodon scabripinnis]AOR39688.1 ATPase subunit 8 [Psalidodon paranae]AQM74412.1 ATP synthase f0 subunit 8 [Psalidodon fasciatus]AQM74416.1 ATP synthase f0 subunit 8 [Psalidodon fasciatus]AQM74418.1 ATP synthase f0 subunit 8 [Psalidodon 
MPQLMLTPWFFILVASWMIFLVVIPPKVMKHYFNNEPEMASAHKPKINAWDWMWH